MNAWHDYLEAEQQFFAARHQFVEHESDATASLELALQSVSDRGAALRFLLADSATRVHLFPRLVELSSAGHADIGLVRQVLFLIPTKVRRRDLLNVIKPLLADADDEAFRRFAELLSDLGHSDDLAELVAIAMTSKDADIREVADDFRYA